MNDGSNRGILQQNQGEKWAHLYYTYCCSFFIFAIPARNYALFFAFFSIRIVNFFQTVTLIGKKAPMIVSSDANRNFYPASCL